MIINEEAHLSHFGVKGMHWGVRRAQKHKQGTIEKGINAQLRKGGAPFRSTNPNAVRNRKVAALVVGGVATIGVGAVFTSKFMNSNGHQAVKQIKRNMVMNAPRSDYVQFLLNGT